MLKTRDDFCKLLFRYLEPLRAHYTADGARVVIGHASAQYEDEVIPMEAWARPLWGLAPFWAGGGRSADGFFEHVYPRGLAAGTDPASPSYWGACRDHDQRFVEMAAVAYGLLLAKDVLWEPLDTRSRGNTAAWLGQINEHACPAGNWLFFCALVNIALKRLGMPHDEAQLRECLERIDGFYLGDGWYQDGPTGVPDYYVAFTFEFYALLYAQVEGSDDPDRAVRYLERARIFGPQLALLFAARGEGVPYGRSMTYRFAQSAFFSLAAVAEARGHDLGLSLAEAKGLVARNLVAWSPERICDNGGVMSIGYAYPNLHMAEGYNAAGSPLWALKAFACLALPATDRFWQLDASPLDIAAGVHAIAANELLVQRDGSGEVALYPTGCVPGHPFAQSAAKYAKFAYSTRFGFSVARGYASLAEAAPDSMLAFVLGADERHAGHIFVREGVDGYEAVCGAGAGARTGEDGPEGADAPLAMLSRWSPWPGIEVVTEIEPVAGAPAGTHIRRHRVTSALPVAVEAYDCGFAVPGDYHERTLTDVESACRVRAMCEPEARSGELFLIKPEANTNIACGKTLIPAVRYRIEPGENLLVTRIEVR